MVAGPKVVPQTKGNGDRSASVNPQQQKFVLGVGQTPRASKKQEMEDLCMEDLWQQRLESLGWSPRAASQVRFSRAKSTNAMYRYYVNKYRVFCDTKGVVFPPDRNVCWIVADFLCVCADSCKRPSATLKTVSASITSKYTALGMASPMANCHIK